MDKKPRKKIPTKVRAELQREINSKCPFCDSMDVGQFEVHHIDEDPANSNFSNLILVCPNCHSKITKHEITKEQVENVKKSLPNSVNDIEFASVFMDKSCSWIADDNLPYRFYNRFNNKTQLPLLNFSFINHRKQVVVLTAVHIKTKKLRSGLTGIDKPFILMPSSKCQIPISYSKQGIKHLLKEQLAIPSEHPFQFQVQLFYKDDGETYNITGKNILSFTFIFNDKLDIKIPNIYLNCKSENEEFRIVTIE